MVCQEEFPYQSLPFAVKQVRKKLRKAQPGGGFNERFPLGLDVSRHRTGRARPSDGLPVIFETICASVIVRRPLTPASKYRYNEGQSHACCLFSPAGVLSEPLFPTVSCDNGGLQRQHDGTYCPSDGARVDTVGEVLLQELLPTMKRSKRAFGRTRACNYLATHPSAPQIVLAIERGVSQPACLNTEMTPTRQEQRPPLCAVRDCQN